MNNRWIYVGPKNQPSCMILEQAILFSITRNFNNNENSINLIDFENKPYVLQQTIQPISEIMREEFR